MKKFFALLMVLAMMLMPVGMSFAEEAENALMVGACRLLLEPSEEVMAEQVNFDGNPVTGIYNDQYVRAIVIDNGEEVALLLVLESGSSDRNTMKAAIEAETGIPATNMIVTDIHNHTSIGGDTFAQYALERAIECVKQAQENMVPAMYGYGETNSYININRDRQQEEGYWMQDVNPEGYSDKTLAIIKFTDLEGNLIACFMNYPMHAMAGFNQADVDGQYKVSSNIPGVTCAYIEDRYEGCVAMWTSGAAGNQNPLEIGSPTYYYDGYPEMRDLPDGASFALMELYGQRQALDAIAELNEIDASKTQMPITFIYNTIELPAQKAPEGADMSMNRLLADNLVRKVMGTTEIPERDLVEMEPDPDNPVVMNMQMAVLGDIALVGIPAEIYCEIGRDIKEASPLANTVVIEHTDTPGCGYILDASSAEHDVFQSFSSVIPGSSDELIVDGVLEMMDEYFGLQ